MRRFGIKVNRKRQGNREFKKGYDKRGFAHKIIIFFFIASDKKKQKHPGQRKENSETDDREIKLVHSVISRSCYV
jgi:hypothetical protein